MKNMLYTMYASASDAFDFLKEKPKKAGIFDNHTAQLYAIAGSVALIGGIVIITVLMLRGLWILKLKKDKKGCLYLLVSLLLSIILLGCIYMV